MCSDEIPADGNIAAEAPFSAVPMRCYRAMFAQPIVPVTAAHLMRGAGDWLGGKTLDAYLGTGDVSQDRISV